MVKNAVGDYPNLHVIQAMQHKLSSQCSENNLKEHLDSANLASAFCAPLDDVEIVTGQASFDDVDIHDDIHDGLSTWIDSNDSYALGEDLDDVFADLHYK